MAAEKPDKKEKKEKKEKKRSEEAGISKSGKTSSKKEKKDRKEKLAAAAQDQLQRDAATATADVVVDEMDDVSIAEESKTSLLERTVVPFALPMADEKGMKKAYKTIRKAAKQGTLKRGVKEVIKALRKSPPSAPGYTGFPGIVVIAGDISPQDVISHIPVLCEDHNVPFIFVTSRAELGASARTKRPTSVVMLMEKHDAGKKKTAKESAKDKDDDADDAEAYAEAYAALAKYMHKEYAKQGFWAKGDSKA
ncbi:hypothetical protein XA68_15100 [Ophiocordyceps unilateralis]|uniref:Ribosomal protein eL8/eL30/eS12/Gadd45 domain-containing protein n=1 Tax=Ophiocordyceps unilateralis TaxID=268505 RepID=A0A2A9P952_OPHUN|nr:hypothetical protein XA68_15100 [Ophiocordyceps unilateralis]